MLANPQRLTYVHRSYGKHYGKGSAAPDGHLLCLAIDHRLQQTVQRRNNAKDGNEEPQPHAEESRCFGIACIKHIFYRCGIDNHAVRHYEIHRRSVDNGEYGEQDTAHHPGEEHRQVGHHEVQHQHNHRQRCQQEYLPTSALVTVFSHIAEERYVVKQQCRYTYYA